jgi:serine/threonine protein kinase
MLKMMSFTGISFLPRPTVNSPAHLIAQEFDYRVCLKVYKLRE